MSWLGRALTDPHGEPDIGNLGLFALMLLVIGAIPFSSCMMVIAALYPTFKFDVQAYGLAVAAICGGFATALAAYAATASGRSRYGKPTEANSEGHVG